MNGNRWWCSPDAFPSPTGLIGHCFISGTSLQTTQSTCWANTSRTTCASRWPKPLTATPWPSTSTARVSRYLKRVKTSKAFVKQTMLNGLTEEGLDGLDTMVLFPRPLSLRWLRGLNPLRSSTNEPCFVGHPTVSMSRFNTWFVTYGEPCLTKNASMLLHQRAADHWEQHLEDPAYAVLHLYHQLALDREDLSTKMDEQFERLVAGQSGALAVIFDRATQQRSEDEGLHYWAGRIALHRQEHASVRKHLEGVETDALRNELAYGLAVLEGQSQEAERLLNEQLNGASTVDAARWLLKAAVQRVDDRLFDEMNETNLDDVQTLLGRIKLLMRLGHVHPSRSA